MSKTDVNEQQKRAEAQVENTSAGGHLGGTHLGQAPDAKTINSNERIGSKARPNNGSN